jgi:hypothetical protein
MALGAILDRELKGSLAPAEGKTQGGLALAGVPASDHR